MKALRERWVLWKARREERRALRLLGESLPASPEVAAQDDRLLALGRALADSLRRDQADYGSVAQWARPLVVARGLLDRAVLRALRRRAAQERKLACERNGAEALASAQGPLVEEARAAREAAERALFAVRPLPPAVREVRHFSQFVVKEARNQLVPRAPGLAGLLAGWWIAQTFTDSQLTATLHSWGFGDGPRLAVRSETLHAMGFWLPLLAAAVSSYAGSRLAAFVRARYAPPPAGD